jgi:hypothetical protein
MSIWLGENEIDQFWADANAPVRTTGPSNTPISGPHPDYYHPDWGGGGYVPPSGDVGYDGGYYGQSWDEALPPMAFDTGASWDPWSQPEAVQNPWNDPFSDWGQPAPWAHANPADPYPRSFQPLLDPWSQGQEPDVAGISQALDNMASQRSYYDLLGQSGAQLAGRTVSQGDPGAYYLPGTGLPLGMGNLTGGFEGRATGDLYPDYSAGDLAGDIAGNLTSGERFWGNVLGGANRPADVFGKLPDQWYMPLRQLADTTTAPLTLLTAGMGSEVPIVGSAFEGNILKRLAGEAALGTAGMVSGQEAVKGLDAYSRTDLPGADIADNPWVQGAAGLGAGVLGGAAAFGAIKAAGPTLRGLSRYGPEVAGELAQQVTPTAMMRTFSPGDPLYHGTPQPIEGDVLLRSMNGAGLDIHSLSEGAYLSPSKSHALRFTEGGDTWRADWDARSTTADPHLYEFTPTRDIHLLEWNEPVSMAEFRRIRARVLQSNGPDTWAAVLATIKERGITGLPTGKELYGALTAHLDDYSGNTVNTREVLGIAGFNGISDRGGAFDQVSIWDPDLDLKMIRGGPVDPRTGLPRQVTPAGMVEGEGFNLRPGDEPTPYGKMKPEPLERGQVVYGPGDKEYTVARKFDGYDYYKVRVTDAEGNTVSIPRNFLETQPKAPETGVTHVGGQTAETVAAPREKPLPRTSDGNLKPPTEPPLPPTGDMSFKDAIINHLKGEWYYRISGQAKAELRAGRSRQASGILQGIREGENATEALANARAGAQGRILSTREPLRLTDAQLGQAHTAIVDAVRTGELKPFEVFAAQEGLDAMMRGERPQPAQMRIVRKVFGNDVADLAVEASQGKTAYQFYRGAEREAEATARNFERELKRAADIRAKAEQQVLEAQSKLLAESDPGMPTPRAGKTAKTPAEQRALQRSMDELDRHIEAQAKAFNDADAAEIKAAREYVDRVQRQAEARAQREAARENRAAVETGVAAEKQATQDFYASQEQGIREQQTTQRRILNDRAPERPRVEQPIGEGADIFKQQRAEQRALNQGTREADRVAARLDAHREIDRIPDVPPPMRAEAHRIVDQWTEANRVFLDGIGEANTGFIATALRNIKAGVTGDVGDSYVTHLAVQREVLRSALESSGMDSALAKKLSDFMVNRELGRRYPHAVPERVKDLMTKTKTPRGGKSDPLGAIALGAEALNRVWKNTAFGVFDVGVAGVQGLHAVGTNNAALLAGMVNRLAGAVHLAHFDTMEGSTLARRAQYALDGLVVHASGEGAMSDVRGGGAFDGTVLSLFGKPGRFADTPVKAVMRVMNNFQFGMVLQNAREMIYEGNLVLARAAGADVTDPAVRRSVAVRSNAATSAAHRAASGRRAAAEAGTLMTASMTRAQVQQVGFAVKGFLKPANRAEFVTSAVTLASVGTSLIVADKLLNDAFGLDPFEMDPSKPGFGRITVPIRGHNYSVDIAPQEQVLKYTSQAIRALLEMDPEEAGIAMTKLGLGRLGPTAGVAAKMAGFGFDPVSGRYELGDWGKGMSSAERILYGIVPNTPFVQNLLLGKDIVENVAQLGGFSVNKENDYAARERRISNDADLAQYRMDKTKPAVYANLSPRGQQIARERYGAVESPNETLQANREAAAKVNNERLKAEQDASATLAKTGDGAAFRESINGIQTEAGIRNAQVDEDYQAFKETSKLPDDPMKRAMTQYYALYDLPGMRTFGGQLDFDRFEEEEAKLRATWTDAQKQYVDTQRALTEHVPAVDALKTARNQLDSQGYFTLKDDAWAAFKKEHPAELGDLGDYWKWRDESVQEEYTKLVESGYDRQLARQEAERVVAGYTTISMFNEFYRTEFRHQWVVDNPDLTKSAIFYGYFEPDKAEREFLSGTRKPVVAGR